MRTQNNENQSVVHFQVLLRLSPVKDEVKLAQLAECTINYRPIKSVSPQTDDSSRTAVCPINESALNRSPMKTTMPGVQTTQFPQSSHFKDSKTCAKCAVIPQTIS